MALALERLLLRERELLGRAQGAVMIAAWLPTLACAALLLFLLTWREPAARAPRNSPGKVALLYGVQPFWGETDESLRERSAAASRGSSGKPEPRFVWWVRVARRIGAEIVHRLR
jgi:hypothetical protein